MTFEIFISSAIISTLITVIGNIITAKISHKAAIETAKKTANHEIEKMERIWQHESIVSSDEEFAEMAAVVSKFVSFANGAFSAEAIEKVAAIRSKESGQLGSVMDNLYNSILTDNYRQSDDLLAKAIEEKRRIKGSDTECSRSPNTHP